MNLPDKIRKAVEQLNWGSVSAWLAEVDDGDLEERLETLVAVTLRDGYLIVRRPKVAQTARRDMFVEALKAVVQTNELNELNEKLKAGFAEAQLTEEAYQSLLSTVESQLLPITSPQKLAWAAIANVDWEIRQLARLAKPQVGAGQTIIDPVTAVFQVDESEGSIHPDQASQILQSTLGSTLKMLAYGNDWFDREGLLILPAPVPTDELQKKVAEANVQLAMTWSRLETSDGMCRYFDGEVTKGDINLLAPDGKEHHGKAIKFIFGGEIDLLVRIASERQRRVLLQFFVALFRKRYVTEKVATIEPVPPSPEGYVSLSEAIGGYSLSELLCKSIFEIDTTFGGMLLKEWLRGYAVLEKLAQEHLDGPASPEGAATFEESILIERLTANGLSDAAAQAFIRRACFSKDSTDICDAPLLRCEDGRLCLVDGIAAYNQPALVMLSQLSALGGDVSWKGKAFEKAVIDLFKSQGLSAVHIDRTVEDEIFECDCVVLWDEVLFVFECKNDFLPGNGPQRQFWFFEDQGKAAAQVMRKVKTIEVHREILDEAFGRPVTWKRIVPVVLNAATFSLPSPFKGVYFYDKSALNLFLRKGVIGYSVDRAGQEEPQSIPEGAVQLWEQERPTAADFLRQLERPEQVHRIRRGFRRTRLALGITQDLYIETYAVHRDPTTIAEVAERIGTERR